MQQNKTLTILGIETSCDETAAAVVTSDKRILSNVILSQQEEHMAYGGVVPEIAARSHVHFLQGVIEQSLKEASISLKEVDAIAVTGGPGLIGGVMVGVMTAKAMASALKKPLIAVNHLEGHALTVRLTAEVAFPFLLLLVSGGHCQLLLVRGVGQYKKLGSTKDDALGEAFDKVAKMLGLGYPGGPKVEAAAKQGNPARFSFPRPLITEESCNFSFSGLKTAVSRAVAALKPPSEQDIADICASFQSAVGDVLVNRVGRAVGGGTEPLQALVVAGGVAANQYIKSRLEQVAASHSLPLHVPPIALCTDNAAMIAWAAIERLKKEPSYADSLAFEPKARWPLSVEGLE